MDLLDWSKTIGSLIVSLGGFGAVIGFFANWWGNRLAERISNKEKAQHEQELEKLKTQLELTKSMVARYSEQQFVTYNLLWSSLYDLKVTGDELWELANRKNYNAFTKQLKITRDSIERNGLFIEDEHYRRLQELMAEFKEYQLGKDNLIQGRENAPFNLDNEWGQRMANREHWAEYTRLIVDIKNAFRRQINVQFNA